MKAMKIVIVDDERIMAQELEALIRETDPEVYIGGVCRDGEEALRLVDKIHPDVVFLDIQMPEMSGLDVARRLLDSETSPLVVFATAYDEFAMQAFAVNAVDYLLKPFRESDVQRVLKKLKKLLGSGITRVAAEPKPVSGGLKKITLEKSDRLEVVAVEALQLVAARDRQVFVRTVDGEEYRSRITLQEFEQRLPPERFFRCHRNYIVNVDQIAQIAAWFKKGYVLILKNGGEVPVGRVYVNRMKEYIEL